jgi:hypothetical protein
LGRASSYKVGIACDAAALLVADLALSPARDATPDLINSPSGLSDLGDIIVA